METFLYLLRQLNNSTQIKGVNYVVKFKRITTFIVLVLLLSSSISSSYASSSSGPNGRNWLTDEMRNILYRMYTEMNQFSGPEEARAHLNRYGGEEGMFPAQNKWLINLDITNYARTSRLVYGGPDDVPGNTWTGSQPVSLGFTFFGHTYSNILHPENIMINPRIVRNAATSPEPALTNPILRPFHSNWNDPEYVGTRILGPDADYEDKIAIGNIMIDMWMEHIINRIPELYPTGSNSRDPGTNNGRQFKELDMFKDDEGNFDVRKMRDVFQITSPPTSRSYGTAVAWFVTDNASWGTHRTFFI